MTRPASWTSTRAGRRNRRIGLLFFLFSLGLFAALPTLPPAPGEPSSGDLRSAEAALFGGRPERAYRILQTQCALSPPSEKALSLLAMTLLALDRPLDAARVLARMDAPSAAGQVRALLERNLALHGKVALAEEPFPTPALDPRILKKALAVAPAPGGGAFLMDRAALYTLGPDGRLMATRPFPGALDLSLDASGRPLALAKGSLLWGDRTLTLPPTFGSPDSVAFLPEGAAVLLDGRQHRLLKVDTEGRAVGSAAILVPDPFLVRTDGAGRLYVADGRGGRIFVLGGDLSVLRILDAKASGAPLRRLADFRVDFAGNLLLLDGRSHRLILLSSSGKVLYLSGEENPKVAAAGWDGLNRILFVDERVPRVGGLRP